MPDLVVTATGNVTGAVSALGTLEKAIQRIPAPFANTTKGIEAFQASLNKLTPTLTTVTPAATKAGAALTKIVPGANQATGAMINLGRVVQDAPFGFLGIANNINPLLESFQRLKAETGSTGGALKALVRSLGGAGGLGFVVSIASAAMSFFAMNSMRKSTEEVEKNQKVIERVKDSYQLFTEEVTKLAAAAATEAVKVSVLFGALSDSNIKLDERKVIIKQLNELSPAYLGNLNAEKSSYEQISAAVNSYIDDLGKAAFIKSFLPEFETIFKKLIETQVELRKLNLSQDGVFGMSEEDYAAEKKRLETQIRLFKQDIGSAKKFLEREAGGANNLSEILFGKNPKEVKVKVEKIKIELPKKTDLLPQSDLQDIPKLTLRPDVNVVFKEVKFDDSNIEKTNAALKGFLDKIRTDALAAEFREKVKESIETIGLDLATSIGDALGNALAGGKNVVPNLFGGLMNSVGQQVQELGKFLIKSAITVKVAKEAFKALLANPIAAIAVGIGLIALGALLKAQAAKRFQGFAGGVRDFQGGGIVTVGERGPENIYLPAHSSVQPNNEVMAYGGVNNRIEVFGRLHGSDIYFSNKRTGESFGRNN